MRVLYDISTLGLGQLYEQSRGGSYRADRHRLAGLIASGECDVLCCANHSSVAWQGCAAYLAANPRLRGVPLLGPRVADPTSALRRAIAAAHRGARAIAGSNVLPQWLRRGGALVDRRVHPSVSDASPPVDVFHSSVPLPPRPRGRSPRRFLTFYDMSYTRFPDIYGPAYSQAVRAVLHSLQADDCVITCSEASRAELCDAGVAGPERVFVAALAVDRDVFHPSSDGERVDEARARFGIPDGPYLLSVYSADPRKNIARAIRAFERVVEDEGRDLSYVLVGHPGAGARNGLEHAERSRALRGRVFRTGFVGDEDLAALYRGATAFVYPSLYEGFGLPPLEAMACGTPVVASRTTSLPEVVGDGGLLVDPGDEAALAEAMQAICRDAARRAELRARALAQAARFSWERTARETIAAYRAALAR